MDLENIRTSRTRNNSHYSSSPSFAHKNLRNYSSSPYRQNLHLINSLRLRRKLTDLNNINKDNEKFNSTQQRSKSFNLTEKIYSSYSKKLSDYYTNNKKEISLYGSKKYDMLTIDKLVHEMEDYKNIIIEKIKQNPSYFYNKSNFSIENNDDNLILTPLAQKDYFKMCKPEKKLFKDAERRGVVMRRIEYSYLYDDNKKNKNCDNVKVFTIMKNAVDKIEKNWRQNSKKLKIYKFIIIIKKIIKKQILAFLDNLNNEKLKQIYTLRILNKNNYKNHNLTNIRNFYKKKMKSTNNNNVINIKKPKNHCFISKIIIPNGTFQTNKQMLDSLQKKYYKLILNYKMSQEELTKLNKEYNELNEKYLSDQNQLTEISNKFNSLEELYHAEKLSNENLTKNIQDLSKINEKMKNDLLQLETKYKSEINDLNQNINKLSKANNDINEQKNIEINKLNKLLEEKDIKLNNYIKKMQQMENQNKSKIDLETQSDNSQKYLNNDIDKLKNEINIKNEQINKLSQKNADLNNEIITYKQQKLRLSKKNISNDNISYTNQKKNNIFHTNYDLQNKNILLTHLITDLNNRIKNLSIEYLQLKNKLKIKETEDDKKELNKKINIDNHDIVNKDQDNFTTEELSEDMKKLSNALIGTTKNNNT